MILFILQNAYKSEKYKFNNNEEWHSELMRSHTGRRLSEMVPNNADCRVINSTPKIGDDAKSCYGYDAKHIKKWIDIIKPDVICACGKVAQSGCENIGVSFIRAPHPAWRQLSKEITSKIRQDITASVRDVC